MLPPEKHTPETLIHERKTARKQLALKLLAAAFTYLCILGRAHDHILAAGAAVVIFIAIGHALSDPTDP